MNALTTTRVAAVLQPQTFNELMQFATMAAKSSMVPTAFRGKPEDIMLAVQMGSELGLSPMQAIQNVAVINGRPSVWGDAMPGLCRASPLCEDIVERMEGDGDAMAAVCTAKRRGSKDVIARFSVADAKKAGLWGKQGPWTQYPARMLQMRARSFALRDAFPDVLKGLIAAEEAQDMPEGNGTPYSGPIIEAQAEPAGTREAIKADVPLEPKKRTWATILDEIEALFHAAQTPNAVDAVLASADVQKALDKAQGASTARLDAIIKAATDRTRAPADDVFPGDLPPITGEERVGG